MAKYSDNQIQEAVKELKKILKPNDTVFTVCTHVSQSGMSRRIDCFVATKKNSIKNINYYIERICGYSRSRVDNALVVSGCGMDMGFSIVYSLGCSLWPKGTSKPHGTRNGQPDSAGGYALNHSWL